VDAALGDFWRDLILKLPASSDGDVRVVDAETLEIPDHESQRAELWALAGAEGGDAVAARWAQERRERIEAAAERHPLPIGVTTLAAREEERAPAVAVSERATGRDFGQLVHTLLEWVPFTEEEADRRQRLERMAKALAPSLGLDEDAATRAGQQVDRALGLPVIDRARRAPRVWRELRLWFPDGEFLVEGQADLVFEEDGGLVIVDYKSDAISEDQAQQQAAHHAPQLQLYGRGLSQAFGQPVRERLVLFTALGRTVPV
jgi:ATP-dependent helicase/nuclease subunit A